MQNSQKNQLENNYKFPDIDFNNIPTGWINKLNKEKLITELSRRQLITSGLVPELKNRLQKYLKGESTPDDFEKSVQKITFISEPIDSSVDNTTKNNMTDNKKPYFKPTNFSGSISDNIDSFLKKYNRAAIINGWSESEKTQYIPVFLESSALTFYENIIDSGENINWTELEKKLRLEFEPIAQTDMLRLMLEKRKQLPDEPTVSYINEAESLCRRIDNNMSQVEMVRNIMKGLKPSIARYIGIMGNENLSELKSNVRKYEMIEFMIAGETPKSSIDFETDIIKTKIQQINTNKHTDEIDKIRDEIKDIKTMFSQLLNNDKNIQLQNNIEQKNHYEPNNKLNQNNFNNQQWHTQMPQTYNNLPVLSYNNTPYWNTIPANYNQSYFPENPTINKTRKTNEYTYKNVPNTQRKKCSICSKTNHTEDKCFFKNRSNSTTCQICNKSGHTANNCNLYVNKSKN